MRKSFFAIALAMMAFASGPVAAQTNGPYYATPSWDQQIPAAQRFIVLANWNNQAVLDRETGLVWQTTPFNIIGSDGSFASSDQNCRGLKTGNRKGWRQPTVDELQSLIDPTQVSPPFDSTPALPAGNPFQGVLAGGLRYWTTTDAPGFPNQVYIVDFGAANFSSDDKTTDTPQHLTWCVRGGGSAQ